MQMANRSSPNWSRSSPSAIPSPACEPLYYANVAGDPAKRFLHVTLSAGNDTPRRTAAVRLRASQTLGDEVDKFTAALPGLTGLVSVTAHVLDIDRDRGYST